VADHLGRIEVFQDSHIGINYENKFVMYEKNLGIEKPL
jgi:hypothetical protein